MAKSLYNEIPVVILRELLDYNPHTGVLTWKPRRASVFSAPHLAKAWNARFAGRQTGCKYKPRNTTYLLVGIFGKNYLVHRVAWAIHYGQWPGNELDHWDGDGLNNRINNLRDVVHGVNLKNSRLPRDNTSGHIGVDWYAPTNKWRCRINVNGRAKSLGYFDNIKDAVAARKAAQRQYGFTERHGVSA